MTGFSPWIGDYSRCTGSRLSICGSPGWSVYPSRRAGQRRGILFRLPKYLQAVRHFSLAETGLFAWAPYPCADFGSIAGGWLSGHLIRGNVRVPR